MYRPPDLPCGYGDLEKAIGATFGSLADLGKAFTAEGAGHFGSGWVWLTLSGEALAVTSTHDVATPLTSLGVTPPLACDVWEHAYYLDHKNDRVGFLDAWWDRLANWVFAETQYAAAFKGAPGWRYPLAAVAAVAA